jgi:hypothetical protein
MSNFRRLCAVAALAAAGTIGASQAVAGEYFTATLENDLFAGKDSGYSNGVGLSWGRDGFDRFGPDNLPGWLH